MVTEMGLSVATVYGNLAPEVRRAQAERFREGSADLVIATDSISMGLNLPIARIVMTTTVKFNGVEEEEILASLARQIAGRAGRYGVHEEGLVADFDDDTTEVMRALLKEKVAPLSATGFSVAPSLEHLHRIAAVLSSSAACRAAYSSAEYGRRCLPWPDLNTVVAVTSRGSVRLLSLCKAPSSAVSSCQHHYVPVGRPCARCQPLLIRLHRCKWHTSLHVSEAIR